MSAETAGDESAYPSMYGDSLMRARIEAGIAWTFADRYDAAESLFVALNEEFPRSPIGPLFQAATVHAAMLDDEDPGRVTDLLRLLKTCETRAGAQRDAGVYPAEAEFALALVDAYEAVYEARWGGWFAALKRGRAAKKHFHEALQLDSSLSDCYVGLGNYHYWKAAKTRFLGWLPFVSADPEPGLRELRRAADQGVHARIAGTVGLMWALLNEDRPAEALTLAEDLEREFPGARGAWWGKGAALLALYRWEEASRVFDSIEASLRTTTGEGNFFNMIECAYYRATADYERGAYEDARAECRRAAASPLSRAVRSRQKSKLRELETLERKINRLLAGP